MPLAAIRLSVTQLRPVSGAQSSLDPVGLIDLHIEQFHVRMVAYDQMPVDDSNCAHLGAGKAVTPIALAHQEFRTGYGEDRFVMNEEYAG